MIKVVEGGMGNFLAPPGHASHFYHVQERGRDGNGETALEYALTQSWIPETIKSEIRTLLAKHPGEYSQDWERQVYSHYKGCYSPDGVNRNVSSLIKDGPPEYSLSYLLIKSYFPDAKPRLDLI
jgi:hypothetical protein